MKSINNFGLTDKQVKEAQEKYELLEPLMDSYLNPDEKKELRQKICQILGITKRTLRRYLSNCKKNGIKALARKKRNDAGKYRLFSKEILTKSIELLNQNPYRSVRMLIKLMKQDEKLEPKVSKISESILYYYLKKAGYDSKNRGHIKKNKQSYHRFEADYANQLWQSDARHGIPLPDPDNPDKVKMTYCFVWLDDYSRKILFAKYYWNEKQASLDDSYRNTVLCWGVPEKIYLDNGSVYVSNNFSFVVDAVGTKKIHHPPYSAWCKGKVEFIQKMLKKIQYEFRLAGIKTIDELNMTLNAWIELEYNNKIHSSTGETPNARFKNSMIKHPPKRISDLSWFNSLFLSREERIIDKFKKIRFKSNLYRIEGLAIGERVEIRYNPFDLVEIQVFHRDKYYCNLKAYKLNAKEEKNIPEEKQHENISSESQVYFAKIIEKYLEIKKSDQHEILFSKIKEKK